MTEIQLGVIEARFADMIWEREYAISEGQLPENAATAQIGRLCYDTLIAHAENPLEL